ncbi:MAG TPA: ABC transporter ATP-binding protein, partial [Pilimelia sp.]|nr:ABC transporter ATP-binding protein [Pilimelia sp.]
MTAKTSRDVLSRGLGVLWQGIRLEPHIFAVSVAGSVLFGLLTIGSAYLIGAIIGRVVLPAFETGDIDTGLLAGGAAAVVGLSVLRVVGIFGRRLGAGFMQFRLQARFRRQVTRRYLDLPLAWHHRHSTGTLLSNANSDVEATWFPVAPMPFAVGTVVMLVTAMGVLFATDWVLAMVGLAIFPALFGLNVVYSRRMAPRQTRAQQLRAEVSGIAHESFDGALVVKTMGREGAETARFAAKAHELRDALIAIGRLRGMFDPLLETLPSLGTLIVLVVGTWRLREGAVSVTELVSVTFLFTVLAFPVRAIGWVLSELPRSVAGWDRVQHVLTATGEMAYGSGEFDPPRSGPAALRFDGVTFAYESGQPVLRDVTFDVPPGRTVALVGPSGAGKSTVASL